MALFGRRSSEPRQRFESCWACREQVDVTHETMLTGGIITHNENKHVLHADLPNGQTAYAFECPSHGQSSTAWKSADRAAMGMAMHGREAHGTSWVPGGVGR